MKFLAAALVLVSLNTFAADGVFCRDYNGRIQNILKADWSVCQAQIYDGSICFTGSRQVAINIINSNQVREIFDGTDGSYVKGAHFFGPDAIRYFSVDEANDWSEEQRIGRCKF